jgi:hypothetical protein
MKQHRCLRSWSQSVSRIRSFHCHRMRPESESQFTCAARLPVKSALSQQFASHSLKYSSFQLESRRTL